MNGGSGNEVISFTIAAMQFNPVLGEVEENRRRLVSRLAEAAENGAKLVVFPEMASSGYVWESREEIAPFVETIPGPTTEALLAVTRKFRCYAAVGLPETDAWSGAYYNSAVLIGPEGVVGKYRKTHLFAADPRWAREGDQEIPVFQTEIGRIALLICMDAMYFEPSRIAALQGADIIAFPTNWVGASNNPPSKTWCLRAKENGLYWAASNRSDTERGAVFTGGSAVIEPDGSVQQSLISGEGIVYGQARLDPAKRRNILEARRPHAYQELLLHPYLWKEGETRPISAPESYEVIIPKLLRSGRAEQLAARIRLSLEEINDHLKHAVHRLIVLPELESFPSPSAGELEFFFAELQRLAFVYNGYFAISLLEEVGGRPVPSVYLVGPEGKIGTYRQVHRGRPERRRGEADSVFRTFELPFARVGILTEGDALFPESYRVLAKQGADVIAVCGAGQANDAAWMQRIWAFENDAVLAAAMPAGSSGSQLFLHRQVHLEQDSREGALVGTVHAQMLETARSRPFMRRSKTHLYGRLIE
ncbi:nitrilase-related carbon-nitrogen hydrolase [Paenibacillus abyssi]|uniref:Amidohydrolase n=1 Tax=Paenibacillus abyssi TaxID=1340531 RepID=A0A917FWU5_9BACL|nr:nitrilase-related carbon-nitrogen hydrolase [Paenibacillus abyssi]GGG08725.1 amidohydrolase [Paenibacillus abyssi]